MKRFIAGLFVLCMIVPALADNNREFRATWSITWHQYSSGLSVEQLKARTRDILDKHVESNMNAVLWHVRQGGTVYYPSSIEPWGSYLGYTDPGYDPLEYAIEEAHKRGLELHAWFNTFQTSSTTTGAPAEAHPEWVSRDGNGNPMGSHRCLSPGLKAVRDYTVDLVGEIVNNYDVDGIHFDYVRWNEFDNTEASAAFAKIMEENNMLDGEYPDGMLEYLVEREARRKEKLSKVSSVPSPDNRYLYDINHPESGGIPDSTDIFPDATPGVKFASWGDWRRAATTAFVKAAHDTVQAVKPWVKVSPAALGRYKAGLWDGYHSVFQDAGLWFNEGYIDLLTPMNYHWYSGNDMRSALTSDWGMYIGPGAAAGRPYSVGPASYLMGSWAQHQDIVEECRTIDWVQGFQFFSYGNWKSSSFSEESAHTVFSKLSKQPSYHFLNSEIPGMPSLAVNKVSDSTYALTVTPEEGLSRDQWFVIYRSEDAVVDPASDEIVKIAFGDSAFTFTENFDGLQLNDGTYTYAAGMCSRYWIESDLSPTVETDALPVIPPAVISHTPEDAAVEVPNNQIIHMEFNKSMDPASLENNLNITPDPGNLEFSWDHSNWSIDDHKTCHISGSWDFNQTYTVTASDAVTDQIGLSIDGNGDGIAGDDFSFQFTISGADESAPLVEIERPADGSIQTDPDECIFLGFNELLDHRSLSNVFSLSFNGLTVYPETSVMDTDEDKTVVSVKAKSMLPSSEYITLMMEAGVSDTAGNTMNEYSLTFKTDSVYYTSISMNDNFNGGETWERPGYSGSTSGIIDDESSFSLTSETYVPGMTDVKSGHAVIVWDAESSDAKFARIYSGSHQDGPYVDTSKVMQCYVYGDNSGNQIRFAMREFESAGGDLFEVSPWWTIDWTGWKLLEWDYSEFGEWGGMTSGNLDGGSYVVDCIQFQPADPGDLKDVDVYMDQLRLVSREEGEPEENLPPVLEEIPDTSTAINSALYVYAYWSDPNENDRVTLNLHPDTSDFVYRFYTSNANKIRIRPTNDYMGVAEMMVTATDNGVGELSDTVYFYITVSETGIADVPNEFTLYDNYPNPFNPVTTIAFDLPVSGAVTLEIFNVLGQKVAVPMDGYCMAGHYEVPFNASHLSSGVYVYKVTTGQNVMMKKMTLMK